MHMAIILEYSWHLNIKKKKHMHLLLDSTRATSRMWLPSCLWPPLVGLALTTKVFTQSFIMEPPLWCRRAVRESVACGFLPQENKEAKLREASLNQDQIVCLLRWLFARWCNAVTCLFACQHVTECGLQSSHRHYTGIDGMVNNWLGYSLTYLLCIGKFASN